MTRPDILIVGAGPVGLAMALFSLRAGLRVRIVDAADGPSRFSKAIGLQYRVSEVLALLGLAERFTKAGARPAAVQMYSGAEWLVTLHFADFSNLAGRGAFTPVGIMLPQSETERLLGEALVERGCAVEWGARFTGLGQDASGVRATLLHADGCEEVAEASWFVGCDGARSAVRKALGLGFSGETYPLSFAIADVDSDWPAERDAVHVWFHPEGSAAALPLPGQRRWRLFIETTRLVRAEPESLVFDDIRQFVAERSANAAANIGTCTWLSEFRVNCRMVDSFRRGRAFVAGDAAHIHSPTGGQGITTGMQDAANLAWKLGQVARGASERLLDSYGEERGGHARAVLAETDRNTRVFIGTTRLMRLLRDVLVLPLLRRASVQRRLVRHLSQLDLNYRGSSLARPGGGMKRRAGDRAPDVVLGAGREQTSLFALLRPGRMIALVGVTAGKAASLLAPTLGFLGLDVHTIAVPGGPVAPSSALTDMHGDLARLYGFGARSLIVLRPDGYVGFAARNGAAAFLGARGTLDDWLRLVCGDDAVNQAFGSIDAR